MAENTIALHPMLDLASWQAAETDPSVLVVNGHDIRIVVRNGQLSITDGPPGQPRKRTIQRVPRTVTRVLILAGHGILSLEAIRWLTWADIPWATFDVDTGQLTAISEHGTTDARLLRAQSRAGHDGDLAGIGLEITRYLLSVKLAGQAENLDKYLSSPAADIIREHMQALATADNPMSVEGKAAEYYWSAWSDHVAVPFSPQDMLKVPPHWLGFAQRLSLNGRQPVNADATDPVNAILNYLYRVAETECVHACHAYGLHPALGISHTDKAGRDSMALDLLEALRPVCDAIALSILAPDGMIPYRNDKPAYIDRRWLEETRDGTCRLLAPFTHQLVSHAAELGEIIASHVHKIAQMLAHAGSGVITVPRPVKPAKPSGVRKGLTTVRLRPGVTITQIVPDAIWAELELILPAREAAAHGRKPDPVSRAIVASIATRYVLGCGWSAVPGTDKRVVNRWYEHWRESGAWAKAESILTDAGHLAALVSLPESCCESNPG